MERAKQGGSILGYVIVGGVLILLLLGGAYALRHNWAGKATETANKAADQATNKPAENKRDDNKGASPQGQPSAPQPAAPATPAPAAPAAPTPTQGAQRLPQTGPADTMLSVAILVVLMVSAGLYVQSRRVTASL